LKSHCCIHTRNRKWAFPLITI